MTSLPFVLTIPHSSHQIPPEILSNLALDDWGIRYNVDAGALEIFSGMPGLAVLPALYSRLVVDLNRNPGNHAVKGVTAAVDYNGRLIFLPGREPDEETVRQRVKRFWRPWHQDLERALTIPGIKGLIDCHSLDHTGPPEAPDPGQKRADIILGNNGGPDGQADPGRSGGLACPPDKLKLLGNAFEEVGLSVAYNWPYPGGYIVQHYGPPLMERGAFAVQIEVNKGLVADTAYEKRDKTRAKQVSRMIWRALERAALLL